MVDQGVGFLMGQRTFSESLDRSRTIWSTLPCSSRWYMTFEPFPIFSKSGCTEMLHRAKLTHKAPVGVIDAAIEEQLPELLRGGFAEVRARKKVSGLGRTYM